MKKLVSLFGFLLVFFITIQAITPSSESLSQQDPQDETVADSVSIDDSAPIFYDAEEGNEEEIIPEKEKSPLTWALYLGGASLIIVIITIMIRRNKKDEDEEEE